MLIQCILIVILHFCHPHLLNTHSVQKLKMGTGNNDNCQVSTCRHILVALIHACCTYFTQLQSDVKASSHSEVTLAEVHRLPLGSGSGISPTSSGHILLDSILTSVFKTGTREGMVGSNASLWPAQCDNWEVWVKGVIVNCIAITCEMNFESVQFKQCSSPGKYISI